MIYALLVSYSCLCFLFFGVVADDEDICPWIPACCEEDCCGRGTSWLSPRCELDPGSNGWIPPHSPEHDMGCVKRKCCEEACCGEGQVYFPDIAECIPTGTFEPTDAPTTSPTVSPTAASNYTHIERRVLCIYSKVAEDVGDPSAGDGHAAVLLYDGTNYPPDFKLTTYGAWPTDLATDVKRNDWDDKWDPETYPYIYCEIVTKEQIRDKFNPIIAEIYDWTCTNNCASFAEKIFYKTTGTDIDADDAGGAGTETPREIGKSIREKNGGSNQGPWVPPVLARPQGTTLPGEPNPDSSSFAGKHCFPPLI